MKRPPKVSSSSRRMCFRDCTRSENSGPAWEGAADAGAQGGSRRGPGRIFLHGDHVWGFPSPVSSPGVPSVFVAASSGRGASSFAPVARPFLNSVMAWPSERESSGSFLAPKKNTPSASAIQMSCGPSIAFLLGDWLEHPPSRHPATGEALEASAATIVKPTSGRITESHVPIHTLSCRGVGDKRSQRTGSERTPCRQYGPRRAGSGRGRAHL